MLLWQKSKRKKRRSSRVAFRPGAPHKAGAFVLAFAAIGGVFMLFSTKAAIPYVPDTQHRATCVENSPSKTVVRPGEQFTARIRIRNTGTSTYHPDFAVYLEELREGGRIWNASGTNLSQPVGPNGIATFNLSMRAPSTPGTYSFNWGIAIAMKGFMRNPCTGKTIRVMNPPSVTLQANNQNKNISITRGGNLTLQWSASNSPSNCTASGSWSGGKPASGSENRAGDARSAGTRTYRLTCSNAVGSSSATRTVTVNNPPAPAPQPRPSPPPAGPAPARPSQPRANPSPAPSSPRTPPRTSPADNDSPEPVSVPEPQPPITLSALAVGDSTVRLTWGKADNDSSTHGFEVQRSTDNKDWQTLQEYTTDEVYIDSDVQFETKYYYRVRSIGWEDKKSKFANVEVTTNPFTSNTSGSDLTLESEDRQITVVIPDAAITEDAFCSLRNDHSKPAPEIKNHEVALGPYEVLCKTRDSAIITDFKAPLDVSVQTEAEPYIALKLYGYDDSWTEIADITTAAGSPQAVTTPHFAVLGEKKSSPLILKIAIGLGIAAGTIAGGVILLGLLGRYKQQRAIKSKLADYRSKERGY